MLHNIVYVKIMERMHRLHPHSHKVNIRYGQKTRLNTDLSVLEITAGIEEETKVKLNDNINTGTVAGLSSSRSQHGFR